MPNRGLLLIQFGEWVANAIVAFIEAAKSNHKLSSKVDSAFAKLLCTKLDGHELFKHCKGLQREKNELAGEMENTAAEKDKLAKVVVDLKAKLKKSESRLKES